MLQSFFFLLCGIIVWRGAGERAREILAEDRKQTTSDGMTMWSISLKK
jgi:hypothetical protein